MKMREILDGMLVIFGAISLFSILVYGLTVKDIFIATFIGSSIIVVIVLILMLIIQLKHET